MTSRLTTPFGRESTAAEVLKGVDLTGKRAIVTGGASGIGVETARALAGAGAEVTIAVRNQEAGRRTAESIDGTVLVAPLELADRASIAAFVAAWDGPLHILVNNAGMMASPEAHTPEGWELQFATNHFGHFALATGLHPALARAGGARVVSVSSAAHLRSPVVFDDIHFAHRAYEPWSAYGQSKTANVLFAVEATRRWAGDGILVNALHSGGIRTNLQRYVTEDELNRLRGNATPSWKTTEQGAATSVLAAASPSWTASVAATSRTATKRSRTSPGPGPAWPRTRSIRRRPPGCGRSRSTRWPRGDRSPRGVDRLNPARLGNTVV